MKLIDKFIELTRPNVLIANGEELVSSLKSEDPSDIYFENEKIFLKYNINIDVVNAGIEDITFELKSAILTFTESIWDVPDSNIDRTLDLSDYKTIFIKTPNHQYIPKEVTIDFKRKELEIEY
jgi:hypothetical protein